MGGGFFLKNQYNFAATKYLNDNRTTLLPDGWHIPSLDEVDTLIASIGDQATAGRELKNTSQLSSNSGTDSYGFNALPGGYIDYGGDFRTTSEDYESRGTFTGFWTTNSYSERYPQYIYEFVLYGTLDALTVDYYYWDSSCYIRLVRNL